jgi:hypothetical protein
MSGQFRNPKSENRNSAARRGSALIVALWVILLLTILVGSMAFEMRVEANVAGFYRKRVKAQYLAQAGVEWTKALLNKKVTQTLVDGELQVESDEDEDLVRNAYRVQKMGQGFDITRPLGAGQFTLNVRPESAKGFNINTLAQQAANDEDARCVLEEILDQAEVPLELQDELIDCLIDWVDPGDEHRINGAESDDPFYEDRGYEVKNGPLDSVEELLLIKGWTEAIVFGGPPLEEDGPPLPGLYNKFTVWGDGKLSVNDADQLLLLGICDIDELVVEDIERARRGVDGEAGTLDDGIKDLNEVAGMTPQIAKWLTVRDTKFLRVVSIGEVDGVRSGIWCILQAEGGTVLPVYWREESVE